jgi:alpha,alpha-trehalase
MRTPSELYKEIFIEAHRAGFLRDGKSLADATCELTPDELFEEYEFLKKEGDFDIQAFIEAYFEYPPVRENKFESDTAVSLSDHIDRLWPYLKRKADKKSAGSSRIALPYPYVVPGGRFNEIYYWDSYFTMLGLRASGEKKLLQQMLDNFDYLIQNFGFIPNGSRSYFLTRSQPPFFSLMVSLWMEIEGASSGLKYLPSLVQEHDYWMSGAHELSENQIEVNHCVKLPDGQVLNRYFDQSDQPRDEMYGDDLKLADGYEGDKNLLYRNIRAACESGWDFSSRWLEKPSDLKTIKTLDIIPVDLNCLLYLLENLIGDLYLLEAKANKAEKYYRFASYRKEAILKYCWNDEVGFFCDFDFAKEASCNVISAAGMFPLFVKICDDSQAKRTVELLKNKLLFAGGIATTDIDSSQQWDAPNGWAPLQWIAIVGCRNYELNEVAEEIKMRWLSLNKKVFKKTGKMLEKYNVVDIELEGGGGEYPVQDGFGWTNGVARALLQEK